MKNFQIQNGLVKLVVVFAVSLTGTVSYALSYNMNTAMIFTYQNSAGYWFGGGPIQYVWAGSKNEDEVKDLVSHDSHGDFRFLGKHGKCNVYQSEVDIKSYDNSPDKLAKAMEKRC